MDFCVLGPLRVVADNGAAIDLGGRNQRAVFAVLLANRRRVVSRDRIIEAVWGDRLPTDPINTLQHYISRLRRALGKSATGAEIISRVEEGYVLSLQQDEVDADRFSSGVVAARAARREGLPEESERLLIAAIGEWKGRPYENLDVDALDPDVRELNEAWVDASEDLVDVRLALGRYRECVPELERLVADHPLRERFWGQLMVALYRCGRQAEALRAYQRARRHLAESLGIDPGADLRSLEERILVGDLALDQGTSSTLLVEKSSLGDLPSLPTRFVGRAAALDALSAVLRHSALTTILGASGTGKTRLAIEVAGMANESFVDGVVFVSLDGLVDDRAVARVVAAKVGLREDPQRVLPEALADYVASLDALVILDGCDRVVEGCGDLLARIQRRTSRATVLVTSSVLLGMEGETRFDLAPLGDGSTRHPGTDGIDLFVERGRLVVPGWAPHRGDLETVAEIVSILDGSPLAIELAAARLDARSLNDILTELRSAVAGGRQGVPTSTVSSVVEAAAWSVGQLTAKELRIYESLSVFVQGFDRAAATHVGFSEAGQLDVTDYLARLAQRSLVRVDRSGDVVRYVMPTAMRDLAWNRLLSRKDCSQIRDAHATWFADLASTAEHELRGPDLDRWVQVLSVEQPNLRAALDWCDRSGTVETLHKMTAGLCRFWDWAGRISEATHWVSRALQLRSGPDSTATTWILIWSSYFLTAAGDLEAAMERTEEGISSAEALDDRDQLTAAWGNRGIVHRRRGELAEALDSGRKAQSIGSSGASVWFQAWAASALGATEHETGHNVEARANAQRSLDGFRKLGDQASEAWSLDLLALTALTDGKSDRAEEHARHALLKAHLVGARGTVASTLYTLALVAHQRGDLAHAVSLVSAAHTMTDSGPVTRPSQGDGITAAAATGLTPSEYTVAWDRGRTLDLDELLVP